MAKQLKYRVKTGTAMGNWSGWKTATRTTFGRITIKPWELPQGWSNIEIEEIVEVEEGDVFRQGTYTVTVVGLAKMAADASGNEYTVFPCKYHDEADGELYFTYKRESELLGFERV